MVYLHEPLDQAVFMLNRATFTDGFLLRTKEEEQSDSAQIHSPGLRPERESLRLELVRRSVRLQSDLCAISIEIPHIHRVKATHTLYERGIVAD